MILRCAGNNFFTGADINEFSGPPKEAEYRELWARFEGLKVPMIAAMHGSSIGGGLELALACHYRIAHAHGEVHAARGHAGHHSRAPAARSGCHGSSVSTMRCA